MLREFWKMHGIGNDYIYFDCFEEAVPNPAEVSVKLSDRHVSVGGDGIILILKSAVADAKMRMFNADGSEGKMCGNAIRCVGKFLYEKKNIKKQVLTVETLSGIKTLKLSVKDDVVESVSVQMGKYSVDPEVIPVLLKDTVHVPLKVAGSEYVVTCVSMGNPHCVIFTGSEPMELDLSAIGPRFEKHEVFPEQVNTEFVKVLKRNELFMRVWERGSGETRACGTGACATAVAGVLNGYCDRETEILVHLRGGDLKIVVTDGGEVIMTGPAAFAFYGRAEI